MRLRHLSLAVTCYATRDQVLRLVNMEQSVSQTCSDKRNYLHAVKCHLCHCTNGAILGFPMHPSVSVFWRSTAWPAFALCPSGACLCFCLQYKLPRLCNQQGCGCDQVVGLGHQRFCAFRNPACLFHRHFVTPLRDIADRADFLHVPVPD